MSKNSSSKGFAVLGAASFVVKILAIIYIPFQTWIMGSYGNGIVAKGYSVFTFLFSLSNAGLPNAISKLVAEEVAKKNFKAANKILKCSYWVLLGLGMAVALVMLFGARTLAAWCDQPDIYLMLMMLAPTLIFTSVSCALRGYFQGRQNMVPVAVSQIIEQVLNTVLTVLFEYLLVRYGNTVNHENGLIWGAAGSGLATVIAALGAVVFLCYIYFGASKAKRKKEIGNTPSDLAMPSDRVIYRKILHYSLPAILNTIATCAASLIDNRATQPLRAAGFTEKAATSLFGVYSYQYNRSIILATIFVNALVTTMIPAVSEALALHDEKLVKHRVNRSYKAIYLVTIPSIAGITFLAQPLITLICPTDPIGADLVMLGAWTTIFLTIQSVQTGALIAAGKPTMPSISLIIGMAVKILLNHVLIAIPWLNIKGAIIATSVGYLIAILLNHSQIKQTFRFKTYHIRMMIKPIFASLVMGVACLATFKLFDLFFLLFIHSKTLSSDISIMIAVVVGIGVYFAVMVLTNAVKKSDITGLPMGSKMYRLICKVPALREKLEV